ncbi:MAG: hypothetical protein ACOVOE_04200 [Caulobacter sp.]
MRSKTLSIFIWSGVRIWQGDRAGITPGATPFGFAAFPAGKPALARKVNANPRFERISI